MGTNERLRGRVAPFSDEAVWTGVFPAETNDILISTALKVAYSFLFSELRHRVVRHLQDLPGSPDPTAEADGQQPKSLCVLSNSRFAIRFF